ncbi:MAG: thiamine ABC transporter substrate binding subunit [Pseudomonadota bacterium]
MTLYSILYKRTGVKCILSGLSALSVATLLSLSGPVLASEADKKELTIYTYDSFVADWGPGPAIKENFEAQCDCTVNFVAIDDGVGILSRIQLEGENGQADLILGLDTNLTQEAKETGLLAPHGLTVEQLAPVAAALPVAWEDEVFLPFDYGFFAFVYDKDSLTEPPTSLKELVDGPADQKILIQDPRTSTPGLGLMLWVKAVYGDEAPAAWEKLAEKAVTITKGWSEAYGLFLEGEAPMVLSYTTSPAYHMVVDNDERYKAAAFSEGHYMQVEVAARLKNASEPELAQEFLTFMLSPGFQEAIPTGNWMYPVIDLKDSLPAAFETLVDPAVPLQFSPEEVKESRKDWVAEWLQAVAK